MELKLCRGAEALGSNPDLDDCIFPARGDIFSIGRPGHGVQGGGMGEGEQLEVSPGIPDLYSAIVAGIGKTSSIGRPGDDTQRGGIAIAQYFAISGRIPHLHPAILFATGHTGTVVAIGGRIRRGRQRIDIRRPGNAQDFRRIATVERDISSRETVPGLHRRVIADRNVPLAAFRRRCGATRRPS